MKRYLAGLLLFVAVSPPLWGEERFRPAVKTIVPLVEKALDLELLAAGGVESRLRRARELASSLRPLATLNPLTDSAEILKWVGVLALQEAAWEEGTPEEAQRRLLSLYLEFLGQRETFSAYWRSMRFVALQPGAGAHPSVQLAEQLNALPGYLQRAVRGLGGRETAAQRSPGFRRELLAAEAQVARAEGNFEALLEKARACCRESEQADCLGWQAEALFELDRPDEARPLLARLSEGERAAAEKRARLYQLRQDIRRNALSPAGLRQAAELLGDLGEPGRLLRLLPREAVLSAADGELDRLYLEAFFVDGLQLDAGWDFARRARGKPVARFLARRITLGLAQFLKAVFRHSRPDGGTVSLLEQDLAAFRQYDAPVADLLAINLKLVDYAVGGDKSPQRLKPISAQVREFRRLYPERPEGLELLALLAHLGSKEADAFGEVSRFLEQGDGARFEEELADLLASLAAAKALQENSSRHLDGVIKRLEKLVGKRYQLGLWLGHLRAVRGLTGGQGATSDLTQAVQAYLAFVQQNQAVSGRSDELCDAVLSLATLAMQAKEPAQALELLRQAQGPCADESSLTAARAILELVQADRKEDVSRLLAELAQSAAAMDNQPAQLQALLWLALGLEAVENGEEARKAFTRAAAVYQELEASGRKVYLAPEPLCLPGLFGALDVQVGFSSDSPFSLAVEVGLRTRLQLFPPAAADRRRLQPYLEQ